MLRREIPLIFDNKHKYLYLITRPNLAGIALGWILDVYISGLDGNRNNELITLCPGPILALLIGVAHYCKGVQGENIFAAFQGATPARTVRNYFFLACYNLAVGASVYGIEKALELCADPLTAKVSTFAGMFFISTMLCNCAAMLVENAASEISETFSGCSVKLSEFAKACRIACCGPETTELLTSTASTSPVFTAPPAGQGYGAVSSMGALNA